MKRLLASLAVATIALGPALVIRAQATAAGVAPVSYRNVCAATPSPHIMRCFSIVRVGGPAISPASPNVVAYRPADLQSAYNLTAAAASQGTGQTLVDVLWNDDPNAEHDLNVYRSAFGLPPCTTANGCFKKVNQNGQPSPLPAGDPSVATEWALDIDMFSAICPKCNILMVEASTATDTDLGIAEDTAARMGTEISNSYGEQEPSNSASLEAHYNHPGVAITVSSGDSSYYFGPSFPASSQYVTSVGGTSLYKTSAVPRGWYETAWGCNGRFLACYVGGAAGSGCSKVITKPSWQTDAGCARRTIADVSAVANPSTGVLFYDTYGGSGWGIVGGTSVASPIIAGVYALAGNAASVNYGSYPYSHISSLNDVTKGINGSCGGSYLCTAGPGYDGPTGLGTPNGTGAF